MNAKDAFEPRGAKPGTSPGAGTDPDQRQRDHNSGIIETGGIVWMFAGMGLVGLAAPTGRFLQVESAALSLSALLIMGVSAWLYFTGRGRR